MNGASNKNWKTLGLNLDKSEGWQQQKVERSDLSRRSDLALVLGEAYSTVPILAQLISTIVHEFDV